MSDHEAVDHNILSSKPLLTLMGCGILITERNCLAIGRDFHCVDHSASMTVAIVLIASGLWSSIDSKWIDCKAIRKCGVRRFFMYVE